MAQYGMLVEKEKRMSHPDPLFDPDNAYEDDMNYADDIDASNYDDYNGFYGEDSSNYHPDADHEIASQFDEDTEYDEELEKDWDDSFDDSMDGDAESAFGSCGWAVDEYYNPDCGYGDDW